MDSKFHQELTRLTRQRLGIDGAQAYQGSDEWRLMRLGVITASRAGDVIATGRGGKGTGQARESYMLELIAEIATAQTPEQGGFKQTEWGHEYESKALGIYEFMTDTEMQTIPFIYGDDSMRYGCSPDAIGLEIKSPYTTSVYLDFLLNGKIKPEYVDQVQFCMFVTGLPSWDFANYDPRMKANGFHFVTIERDEAKMKTFADALQQFIADMDAKLQRLGFAFGDQWKHLQGQFDGFSE